MEEDMVVVVEEEEVVVVVVVDLQIAEVEVFCRMTEDLLALRTFELDSLGLVS